MALISKVYGNNVYSIPRKGKRRRKANSVIASYRRRLIEKATDAELAFQHILIDLQIPFEFQKELKRRGHHVAFADFYLGQFHIIVEIDGEYHNDPVVQYEDAQRTKDILKKNKKTHGVVRFTNAQVLTEPDNVKRILCERLFRTKNRNQLSKRARHWIKQP